MLAEIVDKKYVDMISCVAFIIVTLCALGMYLIVIKQYLISRKIVKLAKNQWIPVKEKLPGCSDYYLVMLDDGRILGLSVDVAIIYYKKESDVWTYESEYGNHDIDISDEYFIAWQPLPEPYREE